MPVTIPWDFGELPATVGHPAAYFAERGIVLDCRGPLVIHHKSRWGMGIAVFTVSHETHDWPARFDEVVPYGVTVECGAWIGSMAVLTGCSVGRDAIVAAGTVLRGQHVAPGVMVAGNPARVVARCVEGEWLRLQDPFERLA